MLHTTQAAPELEAMAVFHVSVYTPGMDDRLDQLCSVARIKALPADQCGIVKARVSEIVRARNLAADASLSR